MAKVKRLLEHRNGYNPITLTILATIIASSLGLVITPIVILFNPFMIRYTSKMFRKV